MIKKINKLVNKIKEIRLREFAFAILILSVAMSIAIMISYFAENSGGQSEVKENNSGSGDVSKVTQTEIKEKYKKLEDRIWKKNVQIQNIKDKIQKIQSLKDLRIKQKGKLQGTKKCLENIYPTTLHKDKINIKGCFKG